MSSIGEQIARQFGLSAPDLTDETPLFSSGLLDSFNMIELVALVETNIGKKLRLADINLDNFDSIQRVKALIEQVRG